MLHWVWPTMGLKEVPVEDLTSIPEQQQLNRDDPLCYHGKVITPTRATLQYAKRHAHAILRVYT